MQRHHSILEYMLLDFELFPLIISLQGDSKGVVNPPLYHFQLMMKLKGNPFSIIKKELLNKKKLLQMCYLKKLLKRICKDLSNI